MSPLAGRTETQTERSALPRAAKAPPGLKGLVVADTMVGSVNGSAGFYHYRGNDAAAMAQRAQFEEVVGLLLGTNIPDGSGETEIDVQSHLGRGRAAIAPTAIARWWTSFGQGAEPAPGINRPASTASAPSPMAPLVAGLLATVDDRPTTDMTAEDRLAACLRALAVAPTVLSGSWRLANGSEPLAAQPDLGHAEDYLRMVTGREPTTEAARALEVYLNLTADHGFNASTFTARVITSTGGSVPAALTGAIGALLGPLHGGAPSRVLDMINAIGDPSSAEEWARAQLDAGRKLMGFGHAVYRSQDPRSRILQDVAARFPGSQARELLDNAMEIEQRILALLGRHRPGRTFITNVEYYAALVLHLAGLPQEMFTATFIVSRMAGWSAHLLEQAADNKIVRPSAHYVGPVVDIPREVVEIDVASG